MAPGWRVPTSICLFVAMMVPATPSQKAFTLGVLRRDGIVIPFATYASTRWRTDWPEPRAKVDVPVDLRNVPSRWWGPMGPVDAWQVWTGSEPPRMVRVRQPDWFEAQCLRRIGLRTDYRPTEPPPAPSTQPYPKDGLAVSPPQVVERVEIVPVGLTPDAVVAAFNSVERKVIPAERMVGEWIHPPRDERERIPLKIEAVYAVGADAAARVYYFEAIREYAGQVNNDPKRRECARISYGAGWFVSDGTGPLRPLGFDVAVEPCNREGARFMLPLGAMRLSDRLFWIAQWSGWGYEEYNVVEIKAKGVEVVVRAWGGGC